jgi:hypothetical protein
MKDSGNLFRLLLGFLALLSASFCRWLFEAKIERARNQGRKLANRNAKKYRGRRPLTCLMLLPLLVITLKPLPIFAQDSATEYEDVLTAPTYTRAEVLELLAILNEEADAAIKQAFDEGYKAGATDFAPKVAELEVEKESLEYQLERERIEKKFFPLTVGGTFALGIITHFVYDKYDEMRR